MSLHPKRFSRALAAIVVLSIVLPAFSPVAPARANSLPPLGIVIRGHGFGHGRGMSQFGAFGWATKLGRSWQDIIAFYYGDNGRTLTTLNEADAALTPGGVMSVRLEAHDGKQTAVISDNATASWTGATGTFGALVAQPVSGNTYNVYASTSAVCPAASGVPNGFTLIGSRVAGPIDFVTTNGNNPAAVVPTDVLGLCEAPTATHKNGRVRFYRGGLRATPDAKGFYRTVNLLATETYLRGVVPRESPAGWGDAADGLGMNALRAQAVAARSYALSEARYTYAKTCDTQNCHVYGGAGLRTIGNTSTSLLEDARTDRAIADTANYVVKDANQRVVRTEYTSSNGGRTAGGVFPAKVDEGDLAADPVLQSWSRMVSADALQKKYPSIGVFMSVATTHDGLGGDWGGYTTSVTITGTAGVVTRSGWNFRSDFSLNAPWYGIEHIVPADPAAAPVGSVLFIGDSVGESIATEFATAITPAYPAMNFHACAGRGMAGASCLFAVKPPQINLDGVGIVNATSTPAIAIVALGYNDDPTTFDAKVQQMLSALSSKAVQRIVFVNMSSRATSRNYARSNEILQAATTNPAVTVFNWDAASAAPHQGRWFDNASLCCWVHLSTTGRTEFTMFLRQQLDALRQQNLLPVTASSAPVIFGLPLGRNNNGPMVVSIQKKLNSKLKLKGKARLKVDGIYGPATIRAMKKYQKSVQLRATGVTDRATWETIGYANRTDLVVLRTGSRHPSVSTLQRSLGKVLKKKISVTGVFTTSLANDVKTFQRRAKLKRTGVVNLDTWTVLAATSART
jgi:SpoIID/LytB domain protein